MSGMIFKRGICFVTLLAFVLSSVAPSFAQTINLPLPGAMVLTSAPSSPAVLKGMKVYPDEPLRFDFIVDTGDSHSESGQGPGARGQGFSDHRPLTTDYSLALERSNVNGQTSNEKNFPAGGGDAFDVRRVTSDEELKAESTKLVRYFLASLTTPEEDLWVNLSPYENDRIIPENFGLTEMGRDLLAQDYILKQLTASLMYPESESGKELWKKIYAAAYQKYGTTDIPTDTFNKVWITPSEATVFVNGDAAVIKSSRLKVMLDSDYLAQEKNSESVKRWKGEGVKEDESLPVHLFTSSPIEDTNSLSKQILREVVIPILEREVNTGANFAQLRQIYNAMVLATWFKRNLKESLVGRVYADRNKVKGLGYENSLELRDESLEQKQNGQPDTTASTSLRSTLYAPSSGDPESIWQLYVESFKKGVFNYIKEEPDCAPSAGSGEQGAGDLKPGAGRGEQGEGHNGNNSMLHAPSSMPSAPCSTLIPRKYFSGGFDADAAAVVEVVSSSRMMSDAASSTAGQAVVVSVDLRDEKSGGTLAQAGSMAGDLLEVGRQEVLAGGHWIGRELIRLGVAVKYVETELVKAGQAGSILAGKLKGTQVYHILRKAPELNYSRKELKHFSRQIKDIRHMSKSGRSISQIVELLKARYQAIHDQQDFFDKVRNVVKDFMNGTYSAEIIKMLRELQGVTKFFVFDIDETLTRADIPNFKDLVGTLHQDKDAFVGIATHRPYVHLADGEPSEDEVGQFYKGQLEKIGLDLESLDFVLGLVMIPKTPQELANYKGPRDWHHSSHFAWYLRVKDRSGKPKQYIRKVDSNYQGANKMTGLETLELYFTEIFSENNGLAPEAAKKAAKDLLHRAMLMIVDDDRLNAHLPVGLQFTNKTEQEVLSSYPVEVNGTQEPFMVARGMVDTSPEDGEKIEGRPFKFERDVYEFLKRLLNNRTRGTYATVIPFKAHRIEKADAAMATGLGSVALVAERLGVSPSDRYYARDTFDNLFPRIWSLIGGAEDSIVSGDLNRIVSSLREWGVVAYTPEDENKRMQARREKVRWESPLAGKDVFVVLGSLIEFGGAFESLGFEKGTRLAANVRDVAWGLGENINQHVPQKEGALLVVRDRERRKVYLVSIDSGKDGFFRKNDQGILDVVVTASKFRQRPGSPGVGEMLGAIAERYGVRIISGGYEVNTIGERKSIAQMDADQLKPRSYEGPGADVVRRLAGSAVFVQTSDQGFTDAAMTADDQVLQGRIREEKEARSMAFRLEDFARTHEDPVATRRASARLKDVRGMLLQMLITQPRIQRRIENASVIVADRVPAAAVLFRTSERVKEAPVIILNAKIIGAMSDTELAFLLGHELGHVWFTDAEYTAEEMLARYEELMGGIRAREMAGQIVSNEEKGEATGLLLDRLELLREIEKKADALGALLVRKLSTQEEALRGLRGFFAHLETTFATIIAQVREEWSAAAHDPLFDPHPSSVERDMIMRMVANVDPNDINAWYGMQRTLLSQWPQPIETEPEVRLFRVSEVTFQQVFLNEGFLKKALAFFRRIPAAFSLGRPQRAGHAMTGNKGGIDLDSRNLNLQETGGKVDFAGAVTPASFENIEGFVPVVFSITPMTDPLAFFAPSPGGVR